MRSPALSLVALFVGSTALAWSAKVRHEGEDRPWDATQLELSLAIDPTAGTVAGAATWQVSPHPGASGEWRLDQAGLQIDEVRVDDAPVVFRRELDALLIPLDPTGPHTVSLRYQAKPDSGLHFRGPGPNSPDRYAEVWSQGEDTDNRHWFPLPDGPEDRFLVSGTVRLPPGFQLQAIGEVEGGDGTYRFHLDKPIAGYLVALSVLPADAVGVVVSTEPPISVWSGPGTPAALLAGEGAKLPAMMRFFEERTGAPFPFPQYREVYVQRFIYGGMENPSMTIAARGLLGEGAWPDPRSGREEVSAHELAHQWYGDLLTCRSWSELWLNEGFASFFASEWMSHAYGPVWSARDNLDVAAAAVGAGPMSSRPWSTPDGRHGVHSAVYVRGASLLRMLRELVGEEAFWAAMRRYTRENAWQLVETEDLRRAFEDETGMRLRWFFDQWAHLPGAPNLKVQHSWKDGTLTVRVQQQLPPDREPWIFPLDLEIGGDTPVRRRVWVDEASVVFSMPMAGAPTYLAVDPSGTLVATLEHTQGPTELLAQLGSPSAAARVRALRALAATPPSPASEAAILPLTRDPDPSLAEEAIRALGTLDSATGNAALGALLRDATTSASLRVVAAEALGSRTGQGSAREDLRAAWKSLDAKGELPTESIAAAVLRALRVHDREFAAAEARKVLGRPVRAELHCPREQAAMDVLSREGTATDLRLVLGHVRGDRPAVLLHDAMRAAVRIVIRSEGDKAKVARAIEPILDSAYQRSRSAALGALREVGDEDSIRRLDRFLQEEDTPWLVDQARETRDAIRSGLGAAPPEEAEVRARLDALDVRLNELDAELEQLRTRH